jgi:tape measure domain-containing protein
MARMSLDTAIRLSAEVKGGANITKVQRSLQDLAKGSQTTAREMSTLRAATFQFARANDSTIAGIRSSIGAFRGLQEQAKIGSREFQRYGAEIQKLEGKLRGLDTTATAAGDSLGRRLAAGLASSLATIGAGRAIGGSLGAVVASEESERRLRSLSEGFDQYAAVQSKATESAQRFGVAQTQANQEFAQAYARLRPMGITLEEVATFYNGFNTAAKLSGTTSVEASNAFMQLAQAMGEGVLRGENLNSILEFTPAITVEIAKVMGITVGQIKEFAKEGKISADIVLQALARIERDGAPKLAEAMKGPAQQFRNLQIAGQELQIEIGEALLPTALALTKAATGLLQEINRLPEPVRNAGVAAAAAGVSVLSLTTAMSAVGGIRLATAALTQYTGAATTAGTASAAAATSAGRLLTVLGTLGKIGLITVGVKFAIEGLDELMTGLVGVKDAEAAARSMAERRGLTYVPSAAVTRRNQAASAYVSPFAGARDEAFARAQLITGAPAAAVPLAVQAAGGGGGGRAAAAEVTKGVKELLRLTDAEITAAVNTAIGEYGGLDPRGRTDVFANILARSRSPQYPSNLVDVVTQPGQYAPNFGRSRAQVTNPNLYGRARFEQVKAELMNPQMLAQSIQDVDSRLYFKGISEQRNMVRGVDFLRAPDQNFFHGPGRSDPGRNPQITSQLLSELGDTGSLTGYLDQQTQAAEQLRERQQATTAELEKFIEARTQAVVKLNQESELLGATTDLDRRRLEYAFEQLEINDRAIQAKREFQELEKQLVELGIDYNAEQQLARIESEKQHALKNAQVKAEQDINDLMVERVRMMQQLTSQAAEPAAFQTQGMAVEAQIATLKDDLAEMTNIATLAGKSAETIGGAFGNAFRDLISGAASARQVLAGFFQDVAQGFAQMAAEIIAKQMAMIALQTILKALGAVAGGGSTFAAGGQGGISPTLGFDPGGFAAGDTGIPFFGRALGGGVSAGRPYPVGENGPELFVPYQAGTIIPAEATEALQAINNASLRGLQVPFQATAATAAKASQQGGGSSSSSGLSVPFQRGMEGLSVPFQRGGMDGGGGMSGGGPVDGLIRFEEVRIGEMDFVTRDEAKRMARESAKQGAALALKRYKNNPTDRRGAGLP